MADNLPLIPNKNGGEVRGVLREVLGEPTARLPALGTARPAPSPPAPPPPPPAGDGVRWRETELRAVRAAQLSVLPRPADAYRLRALRPAQSPPPAAAGPLLLRRADLMPPIHENATRKTTLWVQNALATAGDGDVSIVCPIVPTASSPRSPLPPLTPLTECPSVYSMSIGEPVDRAPPKPLTPPPPDQREHIVCIPPTVNFVNFNIGKIYTVGVRLMNVSRAEVRLSVVPPARKELDVQLCGRLAVTSGACAQLCVHFRPNRLRELRDRLAVRVSSGQRVIIPITCYLVPPTLDILVPNLTKSSVLSCELTAGGAGGLGGADGAGRGLAGGGEAVLDLGARLLGEVHSAPLLLRSTADHASFFILTDDAWYSQTMTELGSAGAVMSGPFVVWPCWWRGGGNALRGGVWCCARSPGLQHLALRVLSSTSIMRPLHIIADALYFHPEHISLEAQTKDYDILSDYDPNCEYYVNLGIAFPHRKLSETVQVINHSPLTYTFFWSVREWGVCSCEEEIDNSEGSWHGPVCAGRAGAAGAGARAAGAAERTLDAAALGVQPLCCAVGPRATLTVHVAAADAGLRLGLHRAVLLLILKDVPRKSFPPGIAPQVVSSKIIQQERPIGMEGSRMEVEVCEVVVCQLEVWWTVAPLRFVLDPPYMELPYSRRLSVVELSVRATQLYLGGSAVCMWRGAGRPPPAASPNPASASGLSFSLQLAPGTRAVVPLLLPLTPLSTEYPYVDVTTLEAEGREWVAAARVQRRAAARHPSLWPARQWLGVVPPGSTMHARLLLTNDTHQHVYWWADVFRVVREIPPKSGCSAARACQRCFERFCSCTIVQPARGGLHAKCTQDIKYKVTAPTSDGVVLTLVRVRRTGAGICRVAPAAPSSGRSALLAYRTMAPAVTLAVLHCGGPPETCAGCALVGGGGAVLRPARALVAGLRSCYRLRLKNITSAPTYVQWQQSPDGDSLLRVIFIPEQFPLIGFAEKEVSVVLEARRVCGRRVWLRAAEVRLAYQPLYLIIDAAIGGLEIEHWIPLGDEMICLRRIQREVLPCHEKFPTTPEEAFIWDDNKRAFLHKAWCRCVSQRLQYVAPAPSASPAPGMSSPSISAVWSPQPLTRVCACWAEVHPPPRAPELPLRPIAIQFRKLPLHKVGKQIVRLRNTSVLTAKWSAAVRLGAMPAPQRTIAAIREPWRYAVRDCGVALMLAPAQGLLGAHAVADLVLSAYADTWGVYHDQLLIMMEQFSPLVVDVWMEAVGCPLHFPLRPGANAEHYADNPPVIWVSESDGEREVRAVNTSRVALHVHAYVLRNHGMLQDAYPFRLVLRMFDVPLRTCPCTFAFDNDPDMVMEEGDGDSEEIVQELDTGMELYLAPDYGVQDHTYYMVSPDTQDVCAGGRLRWALEPLAPEPLVPRPAHTLLLRVVPVEPSGAGWSRSEPTPAAVRVRTAVRVDASAALLLSHSMVTARVCALMLPDSDVLRIRKHIMVQNVSSGKLKISACVGEARLEQEWPEGIAGVKVEEKGQGGVAWALVSGERRGPCSVRCQLRRGVRTQALDLVLPPNSSTELVLEAAVSSEGVCPPTAAVKAEAGGGEGCEECDECANPEPFATTLLYTSRLDFYDDFNVHKSVSLCVRVDRPALRVQPALLELGFVCDDDVLKTYFTVTHSSCTETLSVWVVWRGAAEFRLYPRLLLLPPGAARRVYVQYLARYTAALAEGTVHVRAGGAAGAWCRASVCVRARASRDFNCHRPPHDHTDSALPPPPGPYVNEIY